MSLICGDISHSYKKYVAGYISILIIVRRHALAALNTSLLIFFHMELKGLCLHKIPKSRKTLRMICPLSSGQVKYLKVRVCKRIKYR